MTIKQLLQLIDSHRYNEYTVMARFSNNSFLFEFHIGYYDNRLGFVSCVCSRLLSRFNCDVLVSAARRLGYVCYQGQGQGSR